MVASGDLRWSLVRGIFSRSPFCGVQLTRRQLFPREDGEDEWVSEGVQLGGRGSSMGVIGMWTGAEHNPDDPLGSCYTLSHSPPTSQ